MMKVAVISDTHGYLDETIVKYLNDADEIWHAGDIGDPAVIEQLMQLPGKLRAVYGNIDSQQVRVITREVIIEQVAGIPVLITHIAGNPPRYNPGVRQLINQHKPGILVCGHSHILKIMHDKPNNLLFINPGACGRHGFHKKRTMVVFEIINARPSNMKVIELGNRGRS